MPYLNDFRENRAVHLGKGIPPVAVLMLFIAVAFLPGCSRQGEAVSPAASADMMTAPVTAAAVTKETVPVEVHAIGNVEAYSTVTVKSQVDGEIEQVHFTEGQEVHTGDLLFNIDPRPFNALLQQSEANLARDQAQAKNARAQALRNQKLFEAGIISKDQYDQFVTSADALDASVRADQAAAANANLQLGYCTIRSPIDGRTGSLLVHPGNLVKSNDTSLLVINQIHPIYVDFSVPEQYLAQVKAHFANGKLGVIASATDGTQNPDDGVLSFINNTVDQSTGTIMLKGTFPNPSGRLWPGQFVNVALKLSVQADATVVPNQAVQTGEKGSYVYVVKADLTADFRPVVAGATFGGKTVIEKGVEPGEKVVTDGQLRLFPGAKLKIKNPT